MKWAVNSLLLLPLPGRTTCCGITPTTPKCCCTASCGRWCRCSWERSSCCWRFALAPWRFEPRRSRRGSAPTRCATTFPPPQIAAATRPKTLSRRTLTPSCRRRHGPCRCSRCRCDAAIENIKAGSCFLTIRKLTSCLRTAPADLSCLVIGRSGNQDEGKSELFPLIKPNKLDQRRLWTLRFVFESLRRVSLVTSVLWDDTMSFVSWRVNSWNSAASFCSSSLM